MKTLKKENLKNQCSDQDIDQYDGLYIMGADPFRDSGAFITTDTTTNATFQLNIKDTIAARKRYWKEQEKMRQERVASIRKTNVFSSLWGK